jgi:molybdenum cofactor biosynthesis enzyme MoaA
MHHDSGITGGEVTMASKVQTIQGLLKNPERLNQVMVRIAAVVRASFKQDVIVRPHVTDAEIKERAEICYDLFIQMRVDLHYSTHKALDVLPTALRAQLDGTEWKPSDPARSWVGGRVTT